VSSLIKAQAWGSLTKWASRRVEKAFTLSSNIQVSQHSQHSFLVTTHLNPGELPKDFAGQFTESGASCSHGFQIDMDAPCNHAILCLLMSKLDEMENYFGDTWKTATFTRACSEYGSAVMTPPTLKSSLASGLCAALKIAKQRGGPKKPHHRETQHATLQLNRPTTRVSRCGICGGSGHNKHHHKSKG
jgi:hypothetical protein